MCTQLGEATLSCYVDLPSQLNRDSSLKESMYSYSSNFYSLTEESFLEVTKAGSPCKMEEWHEGDCVLIDFNPTELRMAKTWSFGCSEYNSIKYHFIVGPGFEPTTSKAKWSNSCIISSYKTIQSELEEISGVNPVALRAAKTLWSFGHSECNRVKANLMLDLLNDKIINSPLQTGIVNFL